MDAPHPVAVVTPPVVAPPVVAVAASAGGVEALARFVASLPSDLPAAVLVVLHIPDTGPSVLPSILHRAGSLPAGHATDGTPLQPGRVVVAPPGQHLLVEDGHVIVQPGPRLNGHRPSADALLVSVARHLGRRGAGVVLSGTMDDGAAGLRALDLAGGLSLVQEPDEAAFPSMPRAALAEAPGATACPVDAMGAHLAAWARALGAKAPTAACSGEEPTMDDPVAGDRGDDELSAFTCPECGGSLVIDRSFGMERYRCRVGHAFSGEHLMVGKQQALEAALWAAVVALEERADLTRRLQQRFAAGSRPRQVLRYRDELDRIGHQIALLRHVIDDLVERGPLTQDGDDGDGSTG